MTGTVLRYVRVAVPQRPPAAATQAGRRPDRTSTAFKFSDHRVTGVTRAVRYLQPAVDRDTVLTRCIRRNYRSSTVWYYGTPPPACHWQPGSATVTSEAQARPGLGSESAHGGGGLRVTGNCSFC
jgi:hypothetical protein